MRRRAKLGGGINMKGRLLKALIGIVVVAYPLGLGSGVPVANAQGGHLVGTGLQAQYFDSKNFNDLKVTRVDSAVDFDFGASTPDPTIAPDTFSIRWTGAVKASATANHTFYTLSDDGVRLWVNGVQVIDNYTIHTATENFGTIGLVAGKVYDIRLEYFEQTGPAIIRLSWSHPGMSKSVVPQAALLPASRGEAGRVLAQTSWGATESLLDRVQQIGVVAWVDEQLAKPPTGYPVYPYYPSSTPVDCINVSGDPNQQCQRDNYSLFQVQLRFFQNAMTGEDQLRQRVAFALSQIVVVSGNEVALAYAGGDWHQMLTVNAFGNYRSLMGEVTLNPLMGRYLDMVNNDKPNASGTIRPNENFARELLQLFSLGTEQLNLDGTKVLVDGVTVPTYGQAEVEGFAHVFTGWTYPTIPGNTLIRHNPSNYRGPMEAFPGNHDTAAKTLLNGTVLPARDDAAADLNVALDNIFFHPNVAPFISRRLIQHLVSSNPTPAYVARVATVFNDNGSGTKGDLSAVVRAILLDPEARDAAHLTASSGKLKEPVLLMLNIVRSLNGQTDGVYLRSQASTLSQNLFYAPSVFNYYSPDYQLAGTPLLAPEFAIMNSSTAISRSNFVNTAVYTTLIAPDASVLGATGTSLNFTSLQALAGDPPALVERLNEVMMNSSMSQAMKDAIVTAVNAQSSTDTLARARCAAYLVATSAQFQVQR